MILKMDSCAKLQKGTFSVRGKSGDYPTDTPVKNVVTNSASTSMNMRKAERGCRGLNALI